MRKLIIGICSLFLFFSGFSQVRNGWRSVYDKSGRLTQMQCYTNGILIPDSNFYFQYHSEQVIRGIVQGEMNRDGRCTNGQKFHFNEQGNLSSYTIERGGQTIFSTACDFYGTCASTWFDRFDADTGCWLSDSLSFSQGELIIHNSGNSGIAFYNPPVNIDLGGQFVLYVKIPAEGNSVKQGLIFGWKDPENFYLLEITHGDYYSIMYYENGILKQISGAREEIEKSNTQSNEIKISSNGKDLLFEINMAIEMVIPLPRFKGNQTGLITRSRGNARFSEFGLKYPLPRSDPFFTEKWIGKGTGFFISPSGKILTTHDVVMDAKKIRVKGKINGKEFTLPAEIVRLEEDQNLAILQVSERDFSPFEALPFGYTNRKPVTDAPVFSLGYPNAISGIYIEPEDFSGKVLPQSGAYSQTRLLEMSFRSGAMGSPIFDHDGNLMGIVTYRSHEIQFTEAIDFYDNARLIQGHMGRFERSLDSPVKDLPYREKVKKLSEMVVIIESSIFEEIN